jgi:hypothetical protein
MERIMKKFVFATLTVLGLLAVTPMVTGAAHAELFPQPAGTAQGGTNG